MPHPNLRLWLLQDEALQKCRYDPRKVGDEGTSLILGEPFVGKWGSIDHCMHQILVDGILLASKNPQSNDGWFNHMIGAPGEIGREMLVGCLLAHCLVVKCLFGKYVSRLIFVPRLCLNETTPSLESSKPRLLESIQCESSSSAPS